jgi:hypothetical protein
VGWARGFGLLACLTLSCGGSPATAPRTAQSPAPLPALHRGAATDYVAAAGLRWLVVGSPEQVIANAGLYRELARLFPPDRLDRFAQATGVDLRSVPEGLVAGFDYGTLYLAMSPASTRTIERRFAERLTSDPVVRHPDRRIARISGLAGQTPETMVSIDKLLVGVAVGDPTSARVVEGYALRKLARSPAALEGAALSGLPKSIASAPVRFYAPGPFQGEWQRGLRGLLSTATALGVAGEPLEMGKTLRLTAVISGDWPNPTLARDKLEQAWKDLAESSLGRLVGLNQPASAPEISANAELLRLTVELEVRPLASGLEAAVAADVWKMMDFGTGSENRSGPAPEKPAVPR